MKKLNSTQGVPVSIIVMDAFASQAITHGLSGPAVVLFAIAAIIVGLIAYVCFMKGPGMSQAQYSSSRNCRYRATR